MLRFWENASVGAFYSVNQSSQQLWGGVWGNCGNVSIDASRSSSVYGNSDTVQPDALTARIYIKY